MSNRLSRVFFALDSRLLGKDSQGVVYTVTSGETKVKDLLLKPLTVYTLSTLLSTFACLSFLFLRHANIGCGV